jgi:hypothetical protein
VTNTTPVSYEWIATLFRDGSGNERDATATFDTAGTFSLGVYVVIRKPEAGSPPACPDMITNYAGSIVVQVVAEGETNICTAGPTLNNPGTMESVAVCLGENIPRPEFTTPPTFNPGTSTKYTTNCGPYSVDEETNSVEYAYFDHYFFPAIPSSYDSVGPQYHQIFAIAQRQGGSTNCSQFFTQAVGSVTIYVSGTPGTEYHCTGGPTLHTGATITPGSFLICLGASITAPGVSNVSFADGSMDKVEFNCNNGSVDSTVTSLPVSYGANVWLETFPSSFSSTGSFSFKVYANAISGSSTCPNVNGIEVGSFTVTVVNNNASNEVCGVSPTMTNSGAIIPASLQRSYHRGPSNTAACF